MRFLPDWLEKLCMSPDFFRTILLLKYSKCKIVFCVKIMKLPVQNSVKNQQNNMSMLCGNNVAHLFYCHQVAQAGKKMVISEVLRQLFGCENYNK